MCAENHRRYFDKNAKALVKKLVTADLSKRYGNLKAGSDDILGHSWFKGLDLKKMEAKEITPPYKPQVRFFLFLQPRRACNSVAKTRRPGGVQPALDLCAASIRRRMNK